MSLDLDRSTILLSRLPIIDRESGQLFDFNLRINQYIAKEKMKAHQAKLGGKIRAVFVKARRVGVSSLAEGLGTCHIASGPNNRAKIVACLADTSKELFDVPTNLIKNWPFPLPEPLTSKIVYPHKEGDSLMTIMTAQTAIAGRGGRCTFLHLSEAAFFPVGGGAFTSLFNSVPDDPNTSIIVESTAYGKTGIGQAFWEFWEAATKGDNEFIPIFLTWLDDPHCRREPGELSPKDFDEDEKDIESLISCSDRCGRCERCRKTLECVAWRRWAIHNLCQGKVDKFRQEYPVTAEEAFWASITPAFQRDELRYARETVRDPILVGRLSQEMDAYGNPKPGINFTPDSRSPLYIWRPPNPEHHYYIGADCARGIVGKDYASASVWCGQTGEQVARYLQYVGPEAFALLLYLLATFYNTAMVAIELTGNLGLWAQTVLRDKYKYRNFYRWKGRDDRMPTYRPPTNSIGWETNVRTREIMLTAFRSSLHHRTSTVRDAALLLQMEAAEIVEDRWEVPAKVHDDLLIGAMVGWICKEQWHTGALTRPPKLLLGDETKLEQDELEDAKVQVREAKGDLATAIASHWRKMMKLIQTAPKTSQMVESSNPTPNAKPGVDRLAGI